MNTLRTCGDQGGALGGGGDRIGGESADDEDGEGDASKAAAKKLARMAIGHAKGHVSTGASGATKRKNRKQN